MICNPACALLFSRVGCSPAGCRLFLSGCSPSPADRSRAQPQNVQARVAVSKRSGPKRARPDRAARRAAKTNGVPDAEGPAIELRGVTKTLGNLKVLSELDLKVEQGEFVSLLGPSGVGKSTILNVVAGFLAVESGEVRLMGRDMTRTPANRRNLGFIFQEYALFPHMTVEQNVRFALDVRGMKGESAQDRVKETLEVVGLGHTLKRRPQALSGGQRQRVAIARAMVFRPRILLMDEPLSSLDRQLRDELTIETRRLQRDLGVTVLYVTHDQTEALSLSDRVGIVRDGRIEQIGPPSEVHDHPTSVYAARLCGPLNVAPTGQLSELARSQELGKLELGAATPDGRGHSGSSDEFLGVRPHLLGITVGAPPRGANSLGGVVVGVSVVGTGFRYDVDIKLKQPWQIITARPLSQVEVGDTVNVTWLPTDSLFVGH